MIEKIHHITLPTVIDRDSVKTLETNLAEWMELAGVQLHVFDFRFTAKVHPSLYGHMARFRKESEKKKVRVVSINLKPEVLRQLQNDGVDGALGYLKDLKFGDKEKSKDSPEEIKLHLNKYLINSAQVAIKTMFNTTAAANEQPSEKNEDFKPERFFRVAVVDSNGPTINSRFRLYFEKSCLDGLVSAITGAAVQPSDQELIDSTASELLNLIYGTAKSKLNDDRNYNLPPAIPVMIPVPQAFNERANKPGLNVISFTTPHGAFFLEFQLAA